MVAPSAGGALQARCREQVMLQQRSTIGGFYRKNNKFVAWLNGMKKLMYAGHGHGKSMQIKAQNWWQCVPRVRRQGMGMGPAGKTGAAAARKWAAKPPLRLQAQKRAALQGAQAVKSIARYTLV